MASYFPKPGTPAALINSFLCLALLLCLQAARADTLSLKPYRAIYEVSKSGLSTEVERQLIQLNNGSWQITDSTSILFFTVLEQAQVELAGEQLTPLRYSYEQNPGSHKNQVITYDWLNRIATCQLKELARQVELTGPSYDKLSYQIQLRLDLLSGQLNKSKTYTLVDHGRLKHYRVEAMGMESIDTARGPIETLKLRQTSAHDADRETLIWVAPKYDYLMLRLEHSDNGNQYQLLLKSATLLGPGELSADELRSWAG